MPASGASTTRLATGTPPKDHGSVSRTDAVRFPFCVPASGARAISAVTVMDSFHGTNEGMDMASFVKPWFDLTRSQIPDLELFDAHTHLGQHDPDGLKQTPAE